jgi:hypothetical protein
VHLHAYLDDHVYRSMRWSCCRYAGATLISPLRSARQWCWHISATRPAAFFTADDHEALIQRAARIMTPCPPATASRHRCLVARPFAGRAALLEAASAH